MPTAGQLQADALALLAETALPLFCMQSRRSDADNER
jgi:hypothetical protein